MIKNMESDFVKYCVLVNIYKKPLLAVFMSSFIFFSGYYYLKMANQFQIITSISYEMTYVDNQGQNFVVSPDKLSELLLGRASHDYKPDTAESNVLTNTTIYFVRDHYYSNEGIIYIKSGFSGYFTPQKVYASVHDSIVERFGSIVEKATARNIELLQLSLEQMKASISTLQASKSSSKFSTEEKIESTEVQLQQLQEKEKIYEQIIANPKKLFTVLSSGRVQASSIFFPLEEGIKFAIAACLLVSMLFYVFEDILKLLYRKREELRLLMNKETDASA